MTEAIDSILNQTYTDFELILSDNASSDRTEEMARAYAASDPRIRYHRNPENIGGANNGNFTFTLARGKYFRWAADDDICAPRLLEKCVAVLEEHPEVVLCYTMITEIDENGVPYKTMALNRGLAERPSERFGNLLQKDHMCETTYGLIRSSVMRRTRLQQNYTDSDRTLLAELAYMGHFINPGISLL